MSDVRIQMMIEIPVLAADEADAEDVAAYLISSTGTGQEPVYTEVQAPEHGGRFARVAFSADPDKLLLMMARLTTLWARWYDADGRLIPDGP